MAKFKSVNREMLRNVMVDILTEESSRCSDEQFIRLYNLVMWCSLCEHLHKCFDAEDCPYRRVLLEKEVADESDGN